ncbi:hypothetical protein [Sediminicurvatus halobius]|uniref:Uncharacterized protein n=1 Tax=Sediminicurvatus halobius TaxID=2182432 RepID=A0A2U2MWE0_9GAMM|nr:hypothetical protein [Spiribacter halobius]PWG61132.1 hypothetical protein DEM34_18025 [Spiribacter halobius]UEX77708.1 hypothetical protein LMH63_17525 [Spiribacter halobius]
MNHWLANSRRNLLPRSVAACFETALAEWLFTGRVIVYAESRGIRCELCEHPHLSHHYEISNDRTGHALLVGSRCILKFADIRVLDGEGRAITEYAQRRRHLREALKVELRQRALAPLRELWQLDRHNRAEIERAAERLETGRGVSPATLSLVFAEMERRGIEYEPHLYKITLRDASSHRELMAMPQAERELIRPALSNEQLRRYARLFEE